MLACLVSLSSASIDLWKGLNNQGHFDLCLRQGNNLTSLTSNNCTKGDGTRVYFRIYQSDGQNPMPWTQLKGSPPWANTTEGWEIKFDIARETNGVQPFYDISNINASYDFKFDLAFYTPINYGNNGKKAKLYLIENGDGVHVDGGDRHMYFHLKKTPWSMHNPYYDYLGDVDLIYMGSTKNDTELPIFEIQENNYTETDNANTAFAFAWKKHTVKKGDKLRFGFKVHATQFFQRLPLIKDITPKYETYPDPYNLIFNVTGYNNKPVRAGFSLRPYDTKTPCGTTFTPNGTAYTGTDKTDEFQESTKSLFNLQYIDINEVPWNLTANNEGFFCKFKTYNDRNDNSYQKVYDFVHNQNKIIEKDGFKIQFSVLKDPDTNFTLAQFNVSNKNYFERRFALSVIAESDLAGNQSKVQYEPSKGRIVITSNEQYVSYTAFTAAFGNSPSPDKVYVTNDLDKNKAFWQNTANDIEVNGKAVYGMSWTDTVIPGNGYLVYTITFAAFGNVKSPTRLVDKTDWKETYTSTDDANLDISVEDHDGNEPINLKVIENGEEHTYEHFAGTNFKPKMNFTNVKNSIYSVSVQAFNNDTATGFPSNKIEKIVYMKTKPQLSLVKPGKTYYTVRDKYHISGNVTGTSEQVGIYYRFFLPGNPNDSMSAERPAKKLSSSESVNEQFTYEINFDEIWSLSDSEWMVQFYAKDGELKSNAQNFTFKLNPYNQLILQKAGLSKKVARNNENLLGYVVVNDKENNILDIYISIDNNKINAFPKQSIHSIAVNPNAGNDIPFAFHWTIPQDITTGPHEIYFMVKDSEGFRSEVFGPKILFVTA